MVVATVVRTKGSTPQKPGAKLLVREDGSGVGTLGGGCVEGDIWFAAKELMRRGGPAQHREYLLNEDLAAEDGLVCGGTMYFLIDPVYRPGELLPYAREIDAAYRGERAVALATLIRPADGGEAATGAKLFIREDGSSQGTLGTAAVDGDAVKMARELMVHGRNRYVTTPEGAEYFVEAYTTPAAARDLRRRTRLQGRSRPWRSPWASAYSSPTTGRSSPMPSASRRPT